jgi:hypothetical protein
MDTSEPSYNPTKRLKRLHRKKRAGSEGFTLGLKEFAIELQTNGSTGDKKLVTDWLDRKAPEPGKPKKVEKPSVPVAPPKAQAKKR